MSEFYEDDGAPKKCPHCGSTNFTSNTIDMLDVLYGQGPVTEFEVVCECGKIVGYWAYGYWDGDFQRILE